MEQSGTTRLGGPDGRGGPHAFVADLDQPELSQEDRHHLQRVLRLGRGDPLTVSDGEGSWRACRFGEVLEVVSEVRHESRLEPALAVGFAPVKGDRPEWVVQKLTELGVDRIVVLAADRSVVRWEGERARRHLDRLGRVAREAAMQSRRCHLPRIEGMATLADLVDEAGVVRAEAGGAPPAVDHRLVLVGPEGGWTHAEAAQVPATVGLADHVLRAETAAVAAAVLYSGGLRAQRVRPLGRTT